MVEIKDKKTYFDLIKDFEYIPFTQSEGWHDFQTCLKPNSTRFFVDQIEQPTIALFGHVKAFLGLKMLLIEGECFLSDNIEHKKITEFYRSLQSIGVDILEINSSHKYDSQFEIGIRRAGFLRPVGMFSSSFSSVVNIKQELFFDQNWKQNLKKSTKHKQYVEFSSQLTTDQAINFHSLYKEMVNRKQFGDSIKLTQMTRLSNQKGFGYCCVKDENTTILCAIIFFTHNKQTTDIFRVTTTEGRSIASSFYIYPELFEQLNKTDSHFYDMGRITPSIHSKDLLFTFKSGIKGEYVVYNGEWSWYKQAALRPIMYFVKRFLFKRVEV